MSFSSEVKEEVEKKCFTFKNRHSIIGNNVSLEYKKEFLSALFLRTGSVSDPEKFYHLEFVCQTEDEARSLERMIADFHIAAKIVERKGHYVVYLKESDAISDMLSLMGAHQSLMKFENIRILKEVRENVQRQVNCETANLQKTVSAAVRQTQDIELIRDRLGLSALPDSLKETAELRLKLPSATLKELAAQMKEPIGKSGINHRLRRLSQIAEDLRLTSGV